MAARRTKKKRFDGKCEGGELFLLIIQKDNCGWVVYGRGGKYFCKKHELRGIRKAFEIIYHPERVYKKLPPER